MAADKNFESHAVEDGTLVEGRIIPPVEVNSTDYSDVLKFSNCKNIVVKGCTIAGGKEDCIDAVRGENYTFQNCNILPRGANGITVKGSVDGILLENLSFDGHGAECDIELGQFDNYWWIGRAPTRQVTIRNVQALDGKPVVVRLWDSEVPQIENSNVKIIRIPKFIWWPYFVFRAAQTRGIKNVAKPVDSSTFIKTK